MTIEYTYPEQKPIGATVPVKNSEVVWDMAVAGPVLTLKVRGSDWSRSVNVHPEDVPLVCEAMMTLAGHDWPKGGISVEDDVQELAERIIARLKVLKEDRLPDQLDGFAPHRWALIEATRIVREECGVADLQGGPR